jgi:hypothetical protein
LRKIGKPLKKAVEENRKAVEENWKAVEESGKPLKILRPVSPMQLVACVRMDLV